MTGVIVTISLVAAMYYYAAQAKHPLTALGLATAAVSALLVTPQFVSKPTELAGDHRVAFRRAVRGGYWVCVTVGLKFAIAALAAGDIAKKSHSQFLIGLSLLFLAYCFYALVWLIDAASSALASFAETKHPWALRLVGSSRFRWLLAAFTFFVGTLLQLVDAVHG